MAFDITHLFGIDIRLCKRALHAGKLPFCTRIEETRAPSIVAEMNAANDTQNRITALDSIIQSLQRDDSSALRGDETIRLCMKRAAQSLRAHRFQCSKSHV